MNLKRVTGGLVEELPGVGLTTRGEPFDCPPDLAERLLGDGTGRFKAADAAPKGGKR